jgi:C-methyltransferase
LGPLPYAVQTGLPTVEALRGKPLFESLDDDPEFAAIFNDGMTSVSDMVIPPALAAYDFTNVGAIVDVGGGHGRLLAAIFAEIASGARDTVRLRIRCRGSSRDP